jgi:hypothetical protein
MQIPSITDAVALIGILVMLWKTFFSKGDKKKLQVENDRVEAEKDKIGADTADKYEDALAKQLNRIERLETTITVQGQLIEKNNEAITRLEKANKRLTRELDKRDTVIDCFEVYYRELAKKACDSGVENVVLDPPCFNHEEEELF